MHDVGIHVEKSTFRVFLARSARSSRDTEHTYSSRHQASSGATRPKQAPVMEFFESTEVTLHTVSTGALANCHMSLVTFVHTLVACVDVA